MRLSAAVAVLFLGTFVVADTLTVEEGTAELELFPAATLTKKETNSERLRRGLPPLPPTRKRQVLPGFPGLPTFPQPSLTPCSPLSSASGYIRVSVASGDAFYIAKTYSNQDSSSTNQTYRRQFNTVSGTEGLNPTATGSPPSNPTGSPPSSNSTSNSGNTYTIRNRAQAQLFTLPATSTFDLPFNIFANDAPDTAHPYLGAIGSPAYGHDLMTGGLGHAILTGTGLSTGPSAPASDITSSLDGFNSVYGPGESQIWSLDCSSLKITAQWTNDDLTKKPTTIFYDTVMDILGLTGDLSLYNSAFTDGAHAVTFTFEIPTDGPTKRSTEK
ncbi:hypothetical protein C8R43DRAFT_94317 [Mycena crocata]|nr:hypothetical protein C8R43DRAFT_94317 [Mycena crocata]